MAAVVLRRRSQEGPAGPWCAAALLRGRTEVRTERGVSTISRMTTNEAEEHRVMKDTAPRKCTSAAQLIGTRIKELSNWCVKMLDRIRRLVKEAYPDVVEESKWSGVPVWPHDGLICTGETDKNVVKMAFAKGAALDPVAVTLNRSNASSRWRRAS